jgi:thioredoxin 1
MTENNIGKSFDALIKNSDKPVLVDFYADWCGPCKMVSPIIQKIAREYKDKMITIKIDTDKKQDIAAKYKITSIPTIMLFYKEKSLMRLQGAHPYESVKGAIDSNWPL